MSHSRADESGKLCNLEYLLVNLGRNRATAERLIHLFLDNHPVLCQRLDESAKAGDLEAMKTVLHDIRSSCILFSGKTCADLAHSFEENVRCALESPSAVKPTDHYWVEMSGRLQACLNGMANELADYLVSIK